jgi:hypothetical protein
MSNTRHKKHLPGYLHAAKKTQMDRRGYLGKPSKAEPGSAKATGQSQVFAADQRARHAKDYRRVKTA